MQLKRLVSAALFSAILFASATPARAQSSIETVLHSGATGTAFGAVMTVPYFSTVGVQVSGTFSATLVPKVSQDGIIWDVVRCINVATGSAVTSITAAGSYQCSNAGFKYFGVPINVHDSGTVVALGNGTIAVSGAGSSSGGGSGGEVTNAGTFATQESGAALTSLQLLDDAVHAANAALSKAIAMACQFDDVSPGTVTENNVSPVRCSTLRELFGIIRDAAGNARGANVNASNELTTSANTELPAAVQSTTTGQTAPTAPFVNAYIHCQDSSAITVSPCLAGDNTAHDAADAGNPLKIGAKAAGALSTLTPVAAGDRTNLFAGLDGVMLTHPHAPLGDRASGVAAITDGASTSVVAAQGAGIRFCATTLVVSNSSATNVTVDLRDGTAGSVLMTIPAAANMGGGVIPLSVPLCTTANTIFAADPSAAATTVTISAVGFKTAL